MGTTRLIALVPALVVAVISQAGSNQLGACLCVSLAPLCLVVDFYVPLLLYSYPYHSSSSIHVASATLASSLSGSTQRRCRARPPEYTRCPLYSEYHVVLLVLRVPRCTHSTPRALSAVRAAWWRRRPAGRVAQHPTGGPGTGSGHTLRVACDDGCASYVAAMGVRRTLQRRVCVVRCSDGCASLAVRRRVAAAVCAAAGAALHELAQRNGRVPEQCAPKWERPERE